MLVLELEFEAQNTAKKLHDFRHPDLVPQFKRVIKHPKGT